MSDNVLQLQQAKREPVPGVVTALEEILAAAKAGDVRGIVGMAELGHSSRSFFAGEWDRPHQVYALEQLKFSLMLDAEQGKTSQ